MKAVSFCLVLLLFGQQIAWAEVYNLKEQADGADYALAITAGVLSSYMVSADWGVLQTFTYTYAIPKISDWAIRKGTGLKGKSADVASAALSSFAISGLDYSRSAQQMAQQSTQKASNMLMRMYLGMKKFFTGFFTAKNEVWSGALVDGLSAGAMATAKQEILEEFDDSADEKKIGQFLGLAGSIAVGIGTRWGLQDLFNVYLGYLPGVGPVALKAGENDKYLVYYYDKQGALVTKQVDNLNEVVQIQEGLPEGSPIGYISAQNAPKNDQELAEYLTQRPGSTGKSVAGDDTKLVMMHKTDGRYELNIKDNDGSYRPVIATETVTKPVTIWDEKEGKMVTKNFNVALKGQFIDTLQRAIPVVTRAAVEVGAGLLGAKRELAVLLSAGAGGGVAGRNVSWWKGALQGLEKGVISAGLLHLSRQTKSPVHGAIFNMGASSVLQFAAVTKPLKETLVKEQKPEDLDLSRKTTDLKLEEGQSRDFWLLKEFIGTSATYANADLYSFGRAQPDFKYENGERTFGFRWTSGNDVFFLSRYNDYVRDVRKDGLMPALMNQFVSSYHNQAVENIHSVLNGDISRAEYVKRLAPYTERAEAIKQRMREQDKAKQFLVEKYTKELNGQLQEFNDTNGTNFANPEDLELEAKKLKNEPKSNLSKQQLAVIDESDRISEIKGLVEYFSADSLKQSVSLDIKQDILAQVNEKFGTNFVSLEALEAKSASLKNDSKSGLSDKDKEMIKASEHLSSVDWVKLTQDLSGTTLKRADTRETTRDIWGAIVGGAAFLNPYLAGLIASSKEASGNSLDKQLTDDDEKIMRLADLLQPKIRNVNEMEFYDLLVKQAELDDLKKTNQTYANVYTKLNEDVAMLESSGGWQRLDTIHGKPYSSVPDRLKNKNMVKDYIPVEISEEAIKNTHDFRTNSDIEKVSAAKGMDREIGKIKDVLSNNPDSLPWNEVEKIQPLLEKNPALADSIAHREVSRQDLEDTIDYLNTPSVRDQAYKQADQRAYEKTQADLSSKYNLTGVADYRDVYGNNPSYYSHWEKTNPIPNPAASIPAPAPEIPAIPSKPVDNDVMVKAANFENINLGFRFDKAKMTVDNENELKAKVNELRKIDPDFKNLTVEIPLQSGTDTYSDVENPPHNIHLGLSRTNTIRDFLIGQGIPDQNIKIINNEVPLKTQKADTFGRQKDRTTNMTLGWTTEQVVKESALTPLQKQPLQNVSGTKILQQTMPPKIISLPSEVKIIEHIVQPGETIERIAAKYNSNSEYANKGLTTSSTRIKDLNNITNANKLRSKQVIKIPIE